MAPVTLKRLQQLRLLLAAAALLAPCVWRPAQAQEKPAATVTSADGLRIAYEAHGSGAPALVFVHGWSCDRSYWRQQLAAFAPQHRVVAVDLAGHGDSGLGRKAWTIEAFGADVAAVVKGLGLERVVLIGHSMGGDVIAEAARRLPGRVVGLVWVETYKTLGPGRTPEQVQAFVAPFRAHFVETTRSRVRGMFAPGAEPALVERVANDMSAAPPTVALGALESAFDYSREMPHALQELKLPVVAINADDAPTDLAAMKRHGVEVLIAPGVGHFVMLESPERFNALLRTALARLPR